MAWNTLLLASSGCSTTCGGGNGGQAGEGAGVEGPGTSLDLLVGRGLTRRAGAGGASGDWRRRIEGLMAELERMRVSY